MFPRTSAASSLAVLALVAACAGGTTDVPTDSPTPAELVITPGAATPAAPRRPLRSDFQSAVASLGGSISTPLILTPQTCSATASQTLEITYTITGRQNNPASFQVNTRWDYNGSAWAGTLPVTVNVAAQSPGTTTIKKVTLTVVNASGVGTGTSTLAVPTFNRVTTPQAALNFTNSGATINVQFGPCAVINTPPTLVLPADFTVEATSSAGATVTYIATATDAEDPPGSLTPSCTPASGTTFGFGTTTVSCSVTDGGGLTATGSFKVTVEDTTPAFFTSFPTGTIQLIAANINGAVLDVSALGITAEDVGGVSEPSTWSCDYVAATVLPIGSTTIVSCTAKDARGNESAPSTFDVFVGLNVNAQGFLPPLRMAAPFSVHKRGSTIPHKFLPPTYADGTAAIDLAADLRLAVQQIDNTLSPDAIDVTDLSAGSTVWRYDGIGGQYIFNLKTSTASPWLEGTWRTAVSYKGITLATTLFDLRR